VATGVVFPWTDGESGPAVIERQRSCGTALRRPEHFADGGYQWPCCSTCPRGWWCPVSRRSCT